MTPGTHPAARRIAVVGAGLAGVRLAHALRRLDPHVHVTLLGDEPHAAYERPALSKAYLAGERDAPELGLAGCSFEELAHAGIDVRAGTGATSIDRTGVELATGERIAADSIVLATGARPRRIPTDADPARVHVLRSLDDATRLRAVLVPGVRLVIVGSGFVGAEVAGSAAQLGVRVTLVEAAPVPFARTLGAEAGTWLGSRWRAAGVDVRTGTAIRSIDAGDSIDPLRIRLGDDELLAADHVLVAIGTVPNDELFHDAFPDLGVPGRGIPVDELGRTPVPGVFAVGDVALVHREPDGPTRRVEHWTDAASGAQRLARTLLGLDPGAAPAPYAWSDQFGIRVQVAGHVDPDATTHVDDSSHDSLFVRYLDHDGAVVGVTAVGHAAAVARYRGDLVRR